MGQRLFGWGVVVAGCLGLVSAASAHDGHAHPAAPVAGRKAAEGPVRTPETARQNATTGTGKWTFRHRPLELPAEVQTHLPRAHGGFARDPKSDGGTGATFFSLPGVGLMRLDPELTKLEVLGGDAPLRESNLHNTCLFRENDVTYLALPSDQAQRVFITNTSGRLIRTLPNPYGDSSQPFRVCDVDYVNGVLIAANGYADNVCFVANPFRGLDADPAAGEWTPLRFGGRGTEHGRFGTAHGVTRVPDTDVVTIADRANSRLETYTQKGRYVGGIVLPDGCMPCDVDYHGNVAVVGCLKGPGGKTPAPIYILEDGNIVAELNIGVDLGLAGFTHIHNAAIHVTQDGPGEERIFILAYAWNPGNFAILERVQ